MPSVPASVGEASSVKPCCGTSPRSGPAASVIAEMPIDCSTSTKGEEALPWAPLLAFSTTAVSEWPPAASVPPWKLQAVLVTVAEPRRVATPPTVS